MAIPITTATRKATAAITEQDGTCTGAILCILYFMRVATWPARKGARRGVSVEQGGRKGMGVAVGGEGTVGAVAQRKQEQHVERKCRPYSTHAHTLTHVSLNRPTSQSVSLPHNFSISLSLALFRCLSLLHTQDKSH